MNEHPLTSPTPSPPATPDAPPGKPPRRAPRERLDVALVARGLAPSRERARALIMAGAARVDGQRVAKPGTLVAADASVTLAGESPESRYVSRGGLKLEHALDVFALDPAGLVCLDVGASTGGFTDVLLRRGAVRVYAVDVGRGQLAWALRTNERVVVMERTNIRHLAALPEPVACAVIDVSFISLRLVLPVVAALVTPETPGVPSGWVVALVKPQFEAGRREADRGAGVISDPQVHRRVLRELLTWVRAWMGPDGRRLAVRGLTSSPIAGRDGNREYLLQLAVLAGAVHAHEDGVAIEAVEDGVVDANVDANVDGVVDGVVAAAIANNAQNASGAPDRAPENREGRA